MSPKLKLHGTITVKSLKANQRAPCRALVDWGGLGVAIELARNGKLQTIDSTAKLICGLCLSYHTSLRNNLLTR